MGFKLKDIDITKITKSLGIYQLLHHQQSIDDFSVKGIIWLDNLREQTKLVGKDLDSVTAEVITKSIPGEWDNKLKEYAKNVIVPKVINNSLAVSKCLTNPTTEQKLVCIFEIVVPQQPENERTIFWNGMAALLGHEIALFVTGQPIDFIAILRSIPLIFGKLFKK